MRLFRELSWGYVSIQQGATSEIARRGLPRGASQFLLQVDGYQCDLLTSSFRPAAPLFEFLLSNHIFTWMWFRPVRRHVTSDLIFPVSSHAANAHTADTGLWAWEECNRRAACDAEVALYIALTPRHVRQQHQRIWSVTVKTLGSHGGLKKGNFVSRSGPNGPRNGT